jgi:predicted nucleotidyltransferase
MLTRDDIINKLRDQRSYLAAEYGVSKIGIFGSYAKGHATPNSDVDLVVEFEKPIGFRFIELAEYLELLLGQRVDLLTPAGIQNIRLKRVAQRISRSIMYI